MTPKALVEEFLRLYAGKNIEALMNIFSRHHPLMILGTNLDECLRDHEELKNGFERDFRILSNLTFQDSEKISILENQDQASVLLQIPFNYHFENKLHNVKLRYCFGLLKENNEWKIVQLLVSMPVAG